jgi:hypothetical protein
VYIAGQEGDSILDDVTVFIVTQNGQISSYSLKNWSGQSVIQALPDTVQCASVCYSNQEFFIGGNDGNLYQIATQPTKELAELGTSLNDIGPVSLENLKGLFEVRIVLFFLPFF